MPTLPSSGFAPADTRVDQRTGVRENVGFIELGDERIFSCTYLPPTKPRGGVLICSPLLADLHVSYRREVVTSRELAARGFAVQRFHYRGSSNSDGSVDATDLPALATDAQRAGECLLQIAGIRPTVLLGTRLGAMIAARAACFFEASTFVMWSPTLNTEGYFRDVFRAYVIGQLKDAELDGRSVNDPVAELRQKGYLDVLGYPIAQPFYDSFFGRQLIEEMWPEGGKCLLVQVGGTGLSSPNLRFARQLRRRGMAVDTSVVAGKDAWWFGGGAALREDEAIAAQGIAATTVEWVERNGAGQVS